MQLNGKFYSSHFDFSDKNRRARNLVKMQKLCLTRGKILARRKLHNIHTERRIYKHKVCIYNGERRRQF